MKYAIAGPAGRIFRVLDEANDRTVEITDEQAQTIADGEGAFFIVDGNLVTQQEAMAIRQTERKAIRIAEQFNADPEQAKDLKRQELATARHNAVDGGTTFNGIPIRTDDQTRNELSTARQFAKDDPNLTIQWKLGNGQFITLDSPTIIAMADAVLAHQQAQFTRERELNALVDSATTAGELNAIAW